MSKNRKPLTTEHKAAKAAKERARRAALKTAVVATDGSMPIVTEKQAAKMIKNGDAISLTDACWKRAEEEGKIIQAEIDMPAEEVAPAPVEASKPKTYNKPNNFSSALKRNGERKITITGDGCGGVSVWLPNIQESWDGVMNPGEKLIGGDRLWTISSLTSMTHGWTCNGNIK
jgi:hypothetical protein